MLLLRRTIRTPNQSVEVTYRLQDVYFALLLDTFPEKGKKRKKPEARQNANPAMSIPIFRPWDAPADDTVKLNQTASVLEHRKGLHSPTHRLQDRTLELAFRDLKA